MAVSKAQGKASSPRKVVIVFAGGGTGGHIYPGLAVADELKRALDEKGIGGEIHWIGNKNGMDPDIVGKALEAEGGSISRFHGIPCGKFRRYLSLKNLTDLFKIFAGFIASLHILRKLHPAFLFSKGGYVSVPPCAAARLLGVPYFTHECDATAGLATRLNSAGARRILLSYEETKRSFSAALQAKCVVTGNPVRPVFYTDNSAAARAFLGLGKEHKPLLLVLGGSLGAEQINLLIRDCIEELTKDFFVVHQCGAKFANEHPELMKERRDAYKIYPFIYAELPGVIQAADVVVSRAGANSVWECAVCKKPMILIPLCGEGTRGDQVDNARYFESRHAARVLIGDDASREGLLSALSAFKDPDTRKAYSEGCRNVTQGRRPSAAIAALITEALSL